MHRWDFVAAFLQGTLEPGIVIYCYPPPGYESDALDSQGRPMVCRVERPIYGMAQAGRRWQRALYPWLREFGFETCHGDPNVFHMQEGDETLLLGCYVDDLFTLHSHDGPDTLYRRFIDALDARWSVEDEGEISDLLNVEISSENGAVVLRQTKYIERLVETYVPEDVHDSFRVTDTSADPALPKLVTEALSSECEPAVKELREFQAIIGSLLYCATHTRPDVAYAVALLCRAMSRPTPELYKAATRVLFYLYRHRHVGLRYEPARVPLSGYSDSDWAVKHSTSGFIFNYCSAAISWASKKQPTIALSSCEAELMAVSEAAKEVIYLRSFLHELGVSDDAPTHLSVDNQAAHDLAYNPEHHARTKHIERRHFFVRERVESPFLSCALSRTWPTSLQSHWPLRNSIGSGALS